MFARAMGLTTRLALYSLACLSLMIVDSRYGAMNTLRHAAASVVNPIQATLARPFDYLTEMADFFTVHGKVLRENRALNTLSAQLNSELQGYRMLQEENAQLRELLNLAPPHGTHPLAAEITHVLANPFDRRLIIDKGQRDGVEAGRPVVDAAGLVGQVTQVYPDSSEVTLLTSKLQAAPVLNQRNGFRLIVSGTGSDDLLEIRYLDMHADIRPGDILVTSGIDGVYPAGIPVARVTLVEPPRQSPFAHVVCQPIGAIGQHRHVVVLNRVDNAK
jgi:rod shape-determining protein MreC